MVLALHLGCDPPVEDHLADPSKKVEEMKLKQLFFFLSFFECQFVFVAEPLPVTFHEPDLYHELSEEAVANRIKVSISQ